MNNKKRVIIIVIIIMLLAILSYVSLHLKGKGTTTAPVTKSTAQVMVPCTATLADKPQSVAGWKTYLYPGMMKESTPHPSEKTAMEPSYSLAKITEKTNQPNIFYRVEKPDMSDLPRDMKRVIEICNSDNKTVATGTTTDTTTTGASEHVQASVTFMQSYYIEKKPGTFRVDGFIFTDGKWVLTDRLENVVITE